MHSIINIKREISVPSMTNFEFERVFPFSNAMIYLSINYKELKF